MFWRGVVGYLPMNIVQGLVGLVSIVVFTRWLTPADYGVYALAFSAMSLAHTLLFSWMEASMARFYAAEAQGPHLADHFTTLYRCWIVAAAVFVVIAGAALLGWPGGGPVKVAVAAGLAATLARSLSKLGQERRRAAGDVRGAALTDMVVTLGGFAIGAGLIALGLRGAAPVAGMGVAAAAVLAFLLPGELRRGSGGAFVSAKAQAYLRYGLPVSLSLILALALATTDRFLIAGFLGETAVGVYHAGYSLSNRTLDVMFIWLGAAGGPALIVALERGGHAALQKAAREQAGLMLALALPASVGLALVAKPLADVLVGPALRDGAAQVTPWIAASALFSGLTTYYTHQAFTLGRRTGLLLAAMSIPAGANIVLNLLLIPRHGLTGAMVATTASYGLGLAASIALGQLARPLPLPLGEALRAAAASLVMAAVVMRLPALGGASELMMKAAAGAMVYALAAYVLDVGSLEEPLAPGGPIAAREGGDMKQAVVDNVAWAAAAPRLSVLIPFHRDDPSQLLAALDHGDLPAEIVVLDDGSRDAALAQRVTAAVRALEMPARFLRLAANEGRAAGRNRLAAEARGRHLLFLDADMLPDSADFLARWLQLIQADDPPVAFGGFSLDQAPVTRASAVHRALSLKSDCMPVEARRRAPEKYVFTSNLLIRRDIFEAEPFDPGFVGWGWEDVEWGMRVSRRHPIAHIDNPATHLGLAPAAAMAAKFEQSAANFARVVAAHGDIVRTYPSYRVARALKRAPLRSLWRPLLKAFALVDALPAAPRAFALRLYRAALYAEAV